MFLVAVYMSVDDSCLTCQVLVAHAPEFVYWHRETTMRCKAMTIQRVIISVVVSTFPDTGDYDKAFLRMAFCNIQALDSCR